jgi:methyltransferase-like protein
LYHFQPVRDNTLGPAQRRLLEGLDGKRDRAALLALLEESLRRGELTVEEQGEPVSDPGRARELLIRALSGALDELARTALLVA